MAPLRRSAGYRRSAFYGQRLRIGHGWGSGWFDFGPERRLTRAQDNKLFELDGKPALDLYRDYLGERAGELPGAALLFPLSIRPRADSDDVLVRTILAIDDDQRSMTFAGDMPECCDSSNARASMRPPSNLSGARCSGASATPTATPSRSITC